MTHPYSALAFIYDQMMDHVDYKTWAVYISKIFEFTEIKVDIILDASCGTGELARFLHKMKYKLLASDLSFEMLAVLKSKKEMNKTPVFTADSRYLPLHNDSVVAALMLYDSINYHTNRKDLICTFSEMYRILRPGGIFIFDTVTRMHCMTYFNQEIEKQFWENVGYTRKSRFDNRANIQYTEFDIFLHGEKYHENHMQRIYTMDELIEISKKENFKVVATFDEFSFNRANIHSERIHFVCRKL
jgi:SAM-dependent methyltransferase